MYPLNTVKVKNCQSFLWVCYEEVIAVSLFLILCLWIYLTCSNPTQPNLFSPFFLGEAGGWQEEAFADHSRLLQRLNPPPLVLASVRIPCDLWKVNKGWSTAGPQENREQTRSNTLLLRAAEQREDSGPAWESTVFFLREMWADSRVESSPIQF